MLQFVTTVFFSPRVLHSPCYQQGSRRRADGAEKKLNEVKVGQSTGRADKLSDNRLSAALRCAAWEDFRHRAS